MRARLLRTARRAPSSYGALSVGTPSPSGLRSVGTPSPSGGRALTVGLVLAVLLFAPGCEPAPASSGLTGAPTGSGASSATAGDIRAQPGHDPGPRPPRPANPSELAIVAPVVKGSQLADFEVKSLGWSEPGALEITCQRGAARVVLTVALFVQGGPSPPASTDRYAVFYSLRGAEPEDGERVAKSLAIVLQANKDVPPPPGLGPFVPRPLSL